MNCCINPQGIIGAVRALETVRPSAIIRYEKVSGNAIFTVESSGANAGAVMLTGDVDAEGVTTYTVVIRVCSIIILGTLLAMLLNEQKRPLHMDHTTTYHGSVVTVTISLRKEGVLVLTPLISMHYDITCRVSSTGVCVCGRGSYPAVSMCLLYAHNFIPD